MLTILFLGEFCQLTPANLWSQLTQKKNTVAAHLGAAKNNELKSQYLIQTRNLLSKFPCKKFDFGLITTALNCAATVVGKNV